MNKRILKTGALAVAMTIVFAIFAFRAAELHKSCPSTILPRPCCRLADPVRFEFRSDYEDRTYRARETTQTRLPLTP